MPGPSCGRVERLEKCFFQEFEPTWNGSWVKEGQGGVGGVVEESHFFTDRGKLDTGDGLSRVNAY